ncbi:MAG: Fic family protein [Actinobacteria bacterium]|jgi:death-on-curing protein|nr:Fic family protein [Actinomycetota bacterium]
MIRYLTVEDVFEIGEVAFGGSVTARDVGLLDSACQRPAASAFGVDAYPTLLEKAAALLHSLTANHALIDGNKRTAWLSTVVFLRLNGARVIVPDGYDGPAARLVLAIADGSLREVPEIASRLATMVALPEPE